MGVMGYDLKTGGVVGPKNLADRNAMHRIESIILELFM